MCKISKLFHVKITFILIYKKTGDLGLQQSIGTVRRNHINHNNQFEETNSMVGLLAKCDYWLYDLQRILFRQ